MPQETKAILHDTEHVNLQGRTATAADPQALRKALELALDYRGDVTITRKMGATAPTAQQRSAVGAEALECYIFDIKNAGGPDSIVRAIPKESDEKVAVPLAEIASVAFTGRDTAAGRSFETWMKNYVKKKLAGEEASIQAESLE